MVGEIEVDAAGVLTFDEIGGFAKVDFEMVAGEKGVAVTVLPGVGGEAEEEIEVHGSGEIADGQNGDDAGEGFRCHMRLLFCGRNILSMHMGPQKNEKPDLETDLASLRVDC